MQVTGGGGNPALKTAFIIQFLLVNISEAAIVTVLWDWTSGGAHPS